tara:strand:+ start:10144 stop:10365 length:222 start_codon:yes stop_codon:yes gene_type:complete
MYLEVGEWRREFPDKYYREEDHMGRGVGNYVIDELMNQIKQLKERNAQLEEENRRLKKKKEPSSFTELLKQGD